MAEPVMCGSLDDNEVGCGSRENLFAIFLTGWRDVLYFCDYHTTIPHFYHEAWVVLGRVGVHEV